MAGGDLTQKIIGASVSGEILNLVKRMTGPNDASGVVWALRKSFFFLSVFFNINKCFIDYINTMQVREGSRKRAQTMHLASFGP